MFRRRNNMSTQPNLEELNLLYGFVGLVLNLIKEAIDMKRNGQYWYALDHLRDTMCFIIKRESDEEDIKELIGRIDSVEETSLTITTPDFETTMAKQEYYKDMCAKMLFGKILWRLQEIIDNMGYYAMIKGRGPRPRVAPLGAKIRSVNR